MADSPPVFTQPPAPGPPALLPLPAPPTTSSNLPSPTSPTAGANPGDAGAIGRVAPPAGKQVQVFTHCVVCDDALPSEEHRSQSAARKRRPADCCQNCYMGLWRDVQRVVQRRASRVDLARARRMTVDLDSFLQECLEVGKPCLQLRHRAECPIRAEDIQQLRSTAPPSHERAVDRCTRCRTVAIARVKPELTRRLLEKAVRHRLSDSLARHDEESDSYSEMRAPPRRARSNIALPSASAEARAARRRSVDVVRTDPLRSLAIKHALEHDEDVPDDASLGSDDFPSEPQSRAPTPRVARESSLTRLRRQPPPLYKLPGSGKGIEGMDMPGSTVGADLGPAWTAGQDPSGDRQYAAAPAPAHRGPTQLAYAASPTMVSPYTPSPPPMHVPVMQAAAQGAHGMPSGQGESGLTPYYYQPYAYASAGVQPSRLQTGHPVPSGHHAPGVPMSHPYAVAAHPPGPMHAPAAGYVYAYGAPTPYYPSFGAAPDAHMHVHGPGPAPPVAFAPLQPVYAAPHAPAVQSLLPYAPHLYAAAPRHPAPTWPQQPPPLLPQHTSSGSA